jgi:ankyrin repeat protein
MTSDIYALPAPQAGLLVSSAFEAPVDGPFQRWALDHYGLSILDAKGRDLTTALHCAVTSNDPRLIRELLDMGGSANLAPVVIYTRC